MGGRIELTMAIELHRYSGAVLQRAQNRGGPHQYCTIILLRRHAYHQGIPAGSQGQLPSSVAHLLVYRVDMLTVMRQVLYNKDCISDQAIIYWHQKGSKPQGRQHFLQATQPLVKVRLPCHHFHRRSLLTRICSSCRSRRARTRTRSDGLHCRGSAIHDIYIPSQLPACVSKRSFVDWQK